MCKHFQQGKSKESLRVHRMNAAAHDFLQACKLKLENFFLLFFCPCSLLEKYDEKENLFCKYLALVFIHFPLEGKGHLHNFICP